MTKENIWTNDKPFDDVRAEIIARTLQHVEPLKGKKQDLAIFDYMAGACFAAYRAGILDVELPGFLFLIGVRGGDRLRECEKMLGVLEEKQAQPSLFPTVDVVTTPAVSEDLPESKPAAKK